MTIKRCADCSFKFETSKRGGMAKVCPSCRQGRKDKWRRDKADTRKKEEVKMQGEPTPNSGKTQ